MNVTTFPWLRRALAAAILMVCAAVVHATPVTVDLPAQPLADSILQLSRVAGQVIAVDSALVRDKRAPAVRGALEPLDALRQLLAGSGLTARAQGNSLVVTRPSSGEIALAPVRVEGARYALGPNGSTDPTATEGTGSYATEIATAGSKIPLSIRETPQSISVVTAQQIKDQNLTDMASVLAQMPGVYAYGNSAANNQFGYVSRGFGIANFQIDGGASGVMASYQGITPGAFDMAEFDHVEVIRGADGVFAGQGDPSGTINLVRKRPLDHFQVTGDLLGGSWNNYREQLDVTGPIAFDGAVRARFVAANQDNDYYYQTADSKRTVLYGIVEADLSPTTMLTAGGSYTMWKQRPWILGLPLNDNGADLHLPYSTCVCFSWNRDDYNNSEVFVRFDQRIAKNWDFSVNFTRKEQTEDSMIGGIYNFTPPLLLLNNFVATEQQYLLDVTLHGRFELFDQPQDLTVGGTWQTLQSYDHRPNVGLPYQCCGSLGLGAGSIAPDLSFYPTFNFNPGEFPAPERTGGDNWANQGTIRQYSLYALARLQVLPFLHIFGGFRLSAYQNEYYCGNPLPVAGNCGNTTQNGIITPYDALTIDLTRHWSLYYSYTSIYQPQPNNYFGPPPGTQILPPVEGNEHEFGLKGSVGKVNLTAALYRINQVNSAVGDPAYPNATGGLGGFQVGTWGSCCYLAAGDLLSEGIDLEATGEITPGLRISGSANYNYSVYDNAFAYGTSNKQPIANTDFPPVLFKLWAIYQLPGRYRGFEVGGGINGQTKVYLSGSAQNQYDPTTNQFVGPSVPFVIKQAPFAVFSVHGGWQVSPYVQVTANVNNLFDKHYYTAFNGGTLGCCNARGDPRNFEIAVHAKL